MSHAGGRTLIAFATLVSLGAVALAPSSASARGRGGFGFGFGLGAIAAASAASAPVYVQPEPRVVVAPTVTSERRRHKEARHEPQTPKHPVVTRTIAKPTETADTVAHDADQRKCLTKEYMPDRSVVFKDTCTQEQASVPRSTPAAPQSPQVSKSVVLEPAGANDDLPQQMDGP
jgi:hypothetical protein